MGCMLSALGWSGLYDFLKTRGLAILSDALFNADYDELLEIYISSKKMWPRPHLWSNNNMRGKKFEM